MFLGSGSFCAQELFFSFVLGSCFLLGCPGSEPGQHQPRHSGTTVIQLRILIIAFNIAFFFFNQSKKSKQQAQLILLTVRYGYISLIKSVFLQYLTIVGNNHQY